MKSFKKNCLITFLSLIYLSGLIGVFSSFIIEFHRVSFQSSIIEIPTEKQEVLFFTTEEFQKINWEDENEEFELNGKMYDVSKIVKCKNGFKLFCVNDSLEENLIAMINQWKQSLSQGKTKLLQPQFYNPILTKESLPFFLVKEFSTENGFDFESLKLQINSPPPELV